jgi:predicted acetyltransferase
MSNGFNSVNLVSGEIGLYEKYGYKKIENVTTVHGCEEILFRKVLIDKGKPKM